jgi:hypothetical protein
MALQSLYAVLSWSANPVLLLLLLLQVMTRAYGFEICMMR